MKVISNDTNGTVVLTMTPWEYEIFSRLLLRAEHTDLTPPFFLSRDDRLPDGEYDLKPFLVTMDTFSNYQIVINTLKEATELLEKSIGITSNETQVDNPTDSVLYVGRRDRKSFGGRIE